MYVFCDCNCPKRRGSRAFKLNYKQLNKNKLSILSYEGINMATSLVVQYHGSTTI